MARRKTGSVIAVILVVCLLALAVGGIYWLTNGFKDSIKTFGVKVNGDVILNDRSNLYLGNGASVEVISPFADKYEVKILSIPVNTDFDIPVGDEIYTWNDDVAGTDMTEYFGIETTANGFTLNYVSLAEVITKRIGQTIQVYNTSELFEMRVISGGSTITLKFFVCRGITKIELDRDGIYF